MKRILVIAAVLVGMVPAVTPAAPNVASGAFTRFANSPAGKPLFDIQITTDATPESWTLIGQDVVPFYYEQGMAQFEGTDVVFSSRNSLSRTAAGCGAPLDLVYGECYDVREENSAPIPPDLMARGIDHVGGIDIGQGSSGPGASTVFAPLEAEPQFRTVRAFGAYDLMSLKMTGLLLEETSHQYNSWVAVDPSARYMITAEVGYPIRVYEITRDSNQRIGLTRRADLDVTGAAPDDTHPNFQGCKFASATTLYCSNWSKRNSYFDVKTEIWRIDLSAPIGTAGVTGSGQVAFTFKVTPKSGSQSNVPYGLETEDLAFWHGQLHVQLRGEGLGWVHIVHFAKS